MQKLETRIILQTYHPFYPCCVHAANQLILVDAELDDLMEKTKNRRMTKKEVALSLDLQHTLRMNEIAAPIFGVTAAESFIYNYGVSTIENKHIHSIEHLDKIDTYSKWILIPALSCGKEIDKNCAAMNDLNQLIKIRNSIIHSKPKIINNPNDDQINHFGEKLENSIRERRNIAKKAPAIFLRLVEELLKIDGSAKLREMVTHMGLPMTGLDSRNPKRRNARKKK